MRFVRDVAARRGRRASSGMPSSCSFVVQLIQLDEVEAAHSEQLLVRTLLAEFALVHDEDSVSLSSFRSSLRQISLSFV